MEWDKLEMRCSIDDLPKIVELLSTYESDVTDKPGYSIRGTVLYFLSSPGHMILEPTEGAFFFFHPFNSYTSQCHIVVDKKARGSLLKVKEPLLKYVIDNTEIKKVVGFIPEFHKHCILLLSQFGMEIEGRIKKSFMKENIMYDQIIMGYDIDREEK